jgi:hypothetical protein
VCVLKLNESSNGFVMTDNDNDDDDESRDHNNNVDESLQKCLKCLEHAKITNYKVRHTHDPYRLVLLHFDFIFFIYTTSTMKISNKLVCLFVSFFLGWKDEIVSSLLAY